MTTTTLANVPGEQRQLDERRNNGIQVGLYWDGQQVTVRVHDDAAPVFDFEAVVPAGEARFAFDHPYLFEPAYVAEARRRASRALYAVTEDDVAGDGDGEAIAA